MWHPSFDGGGCHSYSRKCGGQDTANLRPLSGVLLTGSGRLSVSSEATELLKPSDQSSVFGGFSYPAAGLAAQMAEWLMDALGDFHP